jgi:type I restriction enzyme S subunit
MDRAVQISVGSLYPTVNWKDLKKESFFIPDRKKQHEYADLFWDLENLIRLLSQRLQILDELVKSRFIEMFGDLSNTIKMSKLGVCRNGLNFSKLESGYKIKCIGVGDFQTNTYTDEIPEISDILVENEPIGQYLGDGDIVFVRSNGNKELIGRSMLARNIPAKTAFSGFCISFHNESKEILSEFLIHFLHQDLTRQKLFNKGRGANISNLTQAMLGSLEVPVASIASQREFIDFVHQVDKSKVAFVVLLVVTPL